jgi:ribonuclease J
VDEHIKGARAIFDRLGIDLKIIHVSGHASVEDLQRLAAAINADKVIPIQTDVPELFDSFDRVEIHGDGEWWDV